jgi:hypothetical protein
LDTSGKTTFEKPALPNQMARGVEVRTKSTRTLQEAAQSEIRFSPVYAGHAIKPLKNFRFARAPAVLDRIETIRERKAPALIPPGRRIPFLSSNPKRMS